MDGFIVEHPDFIAAVRIFEVVHEVEQRHITVGAVRLLSSIYITWTSQLSGMMRR